MYVETLNAYPEKKLHGGFGGTITDLLQIELGTACGKLYRCSTMAVLDAGDSDILSGGTA
jgi:hypothetical protein